MSGTGEWSPGSLLDRAELLGILVGKWNHFGYAAPEDGQAAIPPLGERNANAISGGHDAVVTIDQITRDLYVLREQLVGELRADMDLRGRRVDAMLTEAAREQPVIGDTPQEVEPSTAGASGGRDHGKGE